MEMFEWREQVAEAASSPEATKKLIPIIRSEIDKIQEHFETTIQRKDANEAVDAAIRLKYYTKVRCFFFSFVSFQSYHLF